MGLPLCISNRVEAEIFAHCQKAWPKEACGILAGLKTAPEGEIGGFVQVYPMRNVEDSPVGYSLDPKEQLQVEKLMRQRGQWMRAIYHSHTATEAYPSPVDVRLAISPDIAYVLVSLMDRSKPVLRPYRIDDDGNVTPWELWREISSPGTRQARWSKV